MKNTLYIKIKLTNSYIVFIFEKCLYIANKDFTTIWAKCFNCLYYTDKETGSERVRGLPRDHDTYLAELRHWPLLVWLQILCSSSEEWRPHALGPMELTPVSSGRSQWQWDTYREVDAGLPGVLVGSGENLRKRIWLLNYHGVSNFCLSCPNKRMKPFNSSSLQVFSGPKGQCIYLPTIHWGLAHQFDYLVIQTFGRI